MDDRPTLLIVDDTPANLDQLSSLLARCRCLVATGGEQALAMVERGARPDLVLLDIVMEGLDGFETLARLRRLPGGEVPVIFISALDRAEDELHGLRLGAVDYIAKPFHPDVVNARVDTQLELRRARAELASRNAELEEMIQLREDVERIVRHDLKSPLGVILSSCELMRFQGELTGRLEASVRRIEVSGHRMLEMINRSLDLYKMETGRYQVAWEPVPLVEALRVSVETLGSLFAACRVEVAWRVEPAAETAVVSGERTLLYSLFENLVRNAVEASPVGAAVTLRAAVAERELVVEVANPGAVPPEIRGSFFEKYATAGKKGGTGLGTYSARLICETLGGRIAMRTSESEGTALELRFALEER